MLPLGDMAFMTYHCGVWLVRSSSCRFMKLSRWGRLYSFAPVADLVTGGLVLVYWSMLEPIDLSLSASFFSEINDIELFLFGLIIGCGLGYLLNVG